MANSGLAFVSLSAGKNVVNTGIEMVTDPETGQLIEQTKVAISDDRVGRHHHHPWPR
jgi:hypothetical protein